MKKLIVTGDDFGLSLAVNEAIEEAHCHGVLGTTSLMAGAKAAGDAVARARRLPSLRVGLHLVLVNGIPISPPRDIPDLVANNGEFSSHLVSAGFNFFFRAGVKHQLEREIRAQFQAFRDSGLPLDHVNCHNHMHIHPTIGGLILKVGRDYGLRAMRYPYEPVLPSWRASRKDLGQKWLSGLVLWPWLALLKRRMNRAGLHSNHFIFGMNDSGRMKLDLVLRILRHLPSGVSEIYFHPASRSGMARTPTASAGQEEFEVLKSPALRQALRAFDIQCTGFSDL